MRWIGMGAVLAVLTLTAPAGAQTESCDAGFEPRLDVLGGTAPRCLSFGLEGDDRVSFASGCQGVTFITCDRCRRGRELLSLEPGGSGSFALNLAQPTTFTWQGAEGAGDFAVQLSAVPCGEGGQTGDVEDSEDDTQAGPGFQCALARSHRGTSNDLPGPAGGALLALALALGLRRRRA